MFLPLHMPVFPCHRVQFVAEVVRGFPDTGGNHVMPVGAGVIHLPLQVGLEALLLQTQIERAAACPAFLQQEFGDFQALFRLED